MKTEAALCFGGNLGDPVTAFAAAIEALARHPAVTVLRISSVYRTAPWGKLDQPEFLNMAVMIATDLAAADLLAFCLRIEREQGRERKERWGPRTLDIDLLTYGEAVIDEPGLQVPHPRIAERAFVLAPLAEIAPALVIGDRSASELRDALANDEVRRDDTETARLRNSVAG